MPQPVDPSFTNAASLAAKGAGTRRLDASLAKLAAATAVKPAESKPGDLADRATLTQTNVLKAVRDAAPLRELGSRLIDLRKAIAGASPTDARASSEKLLEVIGTFDPLGSPTTRLLFDSAFLDLAGDANDANARFTVELGGTGGVVQATFVSGTTIADIAATFSILGKDIGLTARLSGNAIILDSDAPLSANFVGVRVIDDAGANIQSSPGSAIDALKRSLQKGLRAFDADQSLALLDDAIREVEQAERERLLGRAGEPLAIDEDDIPVIREAQAKLLEEARRLGLLIDHDAAKAFDALRP
jgi:hypothetical protein